MPASLLLVFVMGQGKGWELMKSNFFFSGISTSNFYFFCFWCDSFISTVEIVISRSINRMFSLDLLNGVYFCMYEVYTVLYPELKKYMYELEIRFNIFCNGL